MFSAGMLTPGVINVTCTLLAARCCRRRWRLLWFCVIRGFFFFFFFSSRPRCFSRCWPS
jgi:hypothetical protein